MQINEFVEIMNEIAPAELAWEYDNPGLLIGTDRREICKILVALDCSVATAKEAVEWGADLMLTHHPVFFGGVKHILPDDPETAASYILLRNGIALFAAHTNLDAAEGGVNDCLAEVLGLENIEKLLPENMGRIGALSCPVSFGEFAKLVEERLQTRVRITGSADTMINKVAMIGGAGAGDIFAAKAAGADVYITGEMKHHLALQAEIMGLCVIEAGHYETEKVVLQPLIGRLQERANDVQFKLALSETACLRGV